MDIINSIEQLEELYGQPHPNALKKELAALTPEYKKWISQSQFFAFASVGDGGLDCSPRGDANENLIRIVDDTTILIPDRRGNNRLDSLKNIISDPRVALLFFVNGVNETVRVNGHAQISTNLELINSFEFKGTYPKSVIVVKIDAVYFQCARALIRSGLWESTDNAVAKDIPTAGQMTKSAFSEFDAKNYDNELKDRQKRTHYADE